MPNFRTQARRASLAIVCGLVLTNALASCYQEHTCGENDYPVKRSQGPGLTCIPKGQAPPSGYTTFPPGQTPTVPSQQLSPTPPL